MSLEIYRLFPEGLKHADTEQGNPQHDLPLRFVPPKASEKEDDNDTNLKSITVVLNHDMSQKVAPYKYDVMEKFLEMQILFDQLLTQHDSKKKWQKHDKTSLKTLSLSRSK